MKGIEMEVVEFEEEECNLDDMHNDMSNTER
jgi:hypothetical protein